MTSRIVAWATPLLAAVAIVALAWAQEDDVFAFIPDGGRTLLAPLLESAPSDEIETFLGGQLSRGGLAFSSPGARLGNASIGRPRRLSASDCR